VPRRGESNGAAAPRRHCNGGPPGGTAWRGFVAKGAKERQASPRNFDLPSQPEVYVHRIGRSGRAGKSGLAISFAAPDSDPKLAAIEQFTELQLTPVHAETKGAKRPATSLRPRREDANPASVSWGWCGGAGAEATLTTGCGAARRETSGGAVSGLDLPPRAPGFLGLLVAARAVGRRALRDAVRVVMRVQISPIQIRRPRRSDGEARLLRREVRAVLPSDEQLALRCGATSWRCSGAEISGGCRVRVLILPPPAPGRAARAPGFLGLLVAARQCGEGLGETRGES
jgi:hypothetical protein